ncbi:hypothetical protein [Olsenella profusa]|uniref:Uncharacterized protein n=1 Tax=Olsenella profusa F0195 TaxID=1125712 RepID=U2TUX8_9ACTN|nr:hypothetical protein [Olsenella profusa]ERL09878.1 hypothetical protein HMPREF1316_2596 [Olsenella profusa F0195]
MAYEGDFDGEEDLIGTIDRIERRRDAEPNGTTGLPPMVLLVRDEKEALRPVGNLRHLEGMVGDVSHRTVPGTMLVRAAGREWSVPRRCIGRRAKLLLMPGGQLVAGVAGRVVATHDTTVADRPSSYQEGHYVEAIAGKGRYEDQDIEEAARANLALLDRLGTVGGDR